MRTICNLCIGFALGVFGNIDFAQNWHGHLHHLHNVADFGFWVLVVAAVFCIFGGTQS